MANMQEAIELIHRARDLVARGKSPAHKVTEEEALAFLADSESFIADGCGHKVRYRPEPPQSEHYKAGREAHKAGVRWWHNPHRSGTLDAYEWDRGHTDARLAA